MCTHMCTHEMRRSRAGVTAVAAASRVHPGAVLPLALERLREHLRAASARWTVGPNVFTPMDDVERNRHLSYQPSVDELSLRRREAVARLSRLRRDATPPRSRAVDLRMRNGHCFVPAIGERVLDGCTKTILSIVESTMRASEGKPWLSLLPPAEPPVTRSMGRQWLEQVFRELTLNVRDGLDLTETSIARWHELHTHAAMKEWLATRGALLASISVYEDFFAYASGVYHHIAGDLDGGHCVAVIGYDEDAQYWLARNTWGEGWGERGCFRIAVGERGIDASMWGVEMNPRRG